jgi:hypothetical protein
MPNPNTVTASLLGGSPAEIIRTAVTTREPDREVADGDLAWWLALQERLEIRAELAARGLL